MTQWNFPLEDISPDGIRYMPTRVSFPVWQTTANQIEGERNYTREIEFTTRLLNDKFDLNELKLARSPLFPHFPLAIDTDELLPMIKTEYPVDRVEIVEWMQESAACQAILSARREEYNQFSRMETRGGDPWDPGVRIETTRFAAQTGTTVAVRGADVHSPVGSINIPAASGRTLIGRNFLAWGGVQPNPHGIQYTGFLLRWFNLAKTPIDRDIGFPSFWTGTIIAPNFFVQEPNRESSRVRVTMNIASDRTQRCNLRFRAVTDYTQDIDIPADVTLSRGTNEISFIVVSLPSVPLVVAQISPTAGAVLREYTVEAM